MQTRPDKLTPLRSGRVLTFEDIEWEHSGRSEDPSARLLGTLVLQSLNGSTLYLHLEAYAVHTNAQGEQCADVWDEDLAMIYRGVSAEGGWQTIRYHARDYVIIASPFCN